MRLARDLLHQAGNRVGAERQHARQQLEQSDAEREDIRLRRDRARVQLLGRHVGGRAQDHAGARGTAVHQARDAEVHDPHAAVLLVEHDVGRLDVAVDDPALVREVECVRHPCAHLGGQAWRQQPPFGRMHAEVHALDVFHRQVDEALVLARLADLDDVRVRQRARGLGLAQQPQLRFLQQVIGPVVGERERLQRHDGAGILVGRPVDGRRRAATEFLFDLEVMEDLAGPQRLAAQGPLRRGGRRRRLVACRSSVPDRRTSCPPCRKCCAASRRGSIRQAFAPRSLTTLIHG
jgi:hypothetical protein